MPILLFFLLQLSVNFKLKNKKSNLIENKNQLSEERCVDPATLHPLSENIKQKMYCWIVDNFIKKYFSIIFVHIPNVWAIEHYRHYGRQTGGYHSKLKTNNMDVINGDIVFFTHYIIFSILLESSFIVGVGVIHVTPNRKYERGRSNPRTV